MIITANFASSITNTITHIDSIRWLSKDINPDLSVLKGISVVDTIGTFDQIINLIGVMNPKCILDVATITDLINANQVKILGETKNIKIILVKKLSEISPNHRLYGKLSTGTTPDMAEILCQSFTRFRVEKLHDIVFSHIKNIRRIQNLTFDVEYILKLIQEGTNLTYLIIGCVSDDIIEAIGKSNIKDLTIFADSVTQNINSILLNPNIKSFSTSLICEYDPNIPVQL
jgi:hypothetical protein